MPLPIRDGNQSLTTLSTILVSNSHIPAHTVVSFGTQGITDIATAVSGVELGPNTLNALENITVTLGQVTITGGLTDAQLRASAVTVGGGIYLADAQSVIGSSIPPEVIQIGGKNLADSKLYPIAVDSNGVQSIIGAVTASISGTPSVTFGTAVITGSTSILNFPVTQTVTFTQASVTFGVSTITGSVSVLNIPATQTVTFSQAPVTFGTALVTGSTSILNFPATQTVTFTQASVTFSQPTITGSVSVLNFPASQSVTFTTATVTFGTAVITGSTSIINTPSITFGLISGTVTANPTGTQTIAGTVTANGLAVGSTVANVFPIGVDTQFSGVRTVTDLIGYRLPISLGDSSAVVSASLSDPLPAGTNRIGVVTIGAGTVTLGASTAQIGSVTASISNSLTISSLPAISGTVTANLPDGALNVAGIASDQGGARPNYGVQLGYLDAVADEFQLVADNKPLPISGTVTANVSSQDIYGSVSPTAGLSFLRSALYYENLFGGSGEFVRVNDESDGGLPVRTSAGQLLGISGTVTANIFGLDQQGGTLSANIPIISFDTGIEAGSSGYVVPVQISNTVGAIGASNALPISGTVTANSSNGSLTTRFGSVVTANTAFETSAVTNANRKYLLIQNITTASNMITIGIGFMPTTTQGIQLFAGAGLTFEGNYIPTGSVNLLSSVTASCYTILEA